MTVLDEVSVSPFGISARARPCRENVAADGQPRARMLAGMRFRRAWAGGDAIVAGAGEVATEVAEGIRSQGFEPTPSFAACSVCDYRLVCPAAER